MKEILNKTQLDELLNYDPDTGLLTWKAYRAHNAKKGDIAGCRQLYNGKMYIKVRINGVNYLAHRIIWMMVYGEFPEFEIDHKDHDGINNRSSNLRKATHKDNMQNTSKQINNISGENGVGWHKASNKWRAYIQIDGKHVQIGVYQTFFAAAYSRHAANIKYGFHKNHGSG